MGLNRGFQGSLSLPPSWRRRWWTLKVRVEDATTFRSLPADAIEELSSSSTTRWPDVLAPREIEILVRRIADRARPERIILIGSYAKGTTGARSDLDILVIRKPVSPWPKRTADLTPLAPDTLSPFDPHVYTPEEVREYTNEEYSFLHTVPRTGRTVYVGTSPPGPRVWAG